VEQQISPKKINISNICIDNAVFLSKK